MVKRTISRETLKTVGIRLRMLREVLGHSQGEWARVLHIKPPALSQWEQGVRQPNIETLMVVCLATGCTLDFIFRGQVGADMRQELRQALVDAYPSSPYVLVFFSPSSDLPPVPTAPPSAAPSSAKRTRRK